MRKRKSEERLGDRRGEVKERTRGVELGGIGASVGRKERGRRVGKRKSKRRERQERVGEEYFKSTDQRQY